jgi:hypothetical protein
MNNLGFITLQSNDHADIFFVSPVIYADETQSDEALIAVEDPQIDSDKPWMVGWMPQPVPVNIDGDSGVLHAWFKGEVFTEPYVIRVYIECELAEELKSVDRVKVKVDDDPGFEPQELNI